MAPEAAPIAGAEATTKILWPDVDLFHRFVAGDHERFNQSLANALTLHKEYWTADEGRANDAGFPIDAESDYLPRHLLKGTWVGEFHT
ncbi:immunity 49 family protein [Streptomyces sp. NPDC047706]|uniref:immunity 49 family protein n=1 Tax=Streptomyces sp. NPDC047706 TaxID=3365486 RepID=UPI003715B41A